MTDSIRYIVGVNESKQKWGDGEMRIRSTILCSAAFGAVAFGCVPTAAAAQESDGVSEDAEATDAATLVVVGDRKSVGEGKSVSVRVDHGGRRSIKKKKKDRVRRSQK